MSACMTLEEKFEALMRTYEDVTKNYDAAMTNNEELKNQNAYLRRQLGHSLKQKRKDIASSPSTPNSAMKKVEEIAIFSFLLVMKGLQGDQEERKEDL